MKKKNLFEELNINEPQNASYAALDIDVQNIKRRVNDKIASAPKERTVTIMKSKKKLLLIAVVATLMLGITASAASGIAKTWYSSSSSIPDYQSLPTQTQVVKDIGYEAVLIDSFKNGYSFESGCIVKNKLADENGNLIEKFKSISFDYKKGDDTVYFSQNKFVSKTEKQGDLIATENGTDIYYYSYTNKSVPPDYQLTEEDKKAEESGELVFSYGSSKEEIIEIQSVHWEKNDIEFCMMQMDGSLSATELADMAKEAIYKN